MTGNIALDVVIGISFIYLLYSLYATIIMEIISSLLSLRAKNLMYAISRMLMDEKTFDKKRKNLFARIGTTFSRILGKSFNQKNPEIFDDFFKQPSIRYLSSGGLGDRPSYIPPDVFYKALMDSIKIENPDYSELARFESGLEEYADDSDTVIYLKSLIRDAKRDPAKFKILVEQWFQETMDRCAGWFKQTTQCLLLLIGFALAFAFNVNTFTIIRKLSTDKDARDQMIKLATEFVNKNEGLLTTIKDTQNLDKKLDSLLAIQKQLNRDISSTQNLLSGGWHLPDTIILHTNPRTNIGADSVQLTLREKKYIVLHNAVDTRIIKKLVPDKDDIESVTLFSMRYKLNYFFGYRFWGFLMTVLALSLGAPFWFDLLNKLVKLRTSRPVPEDSAAGQPLRRSATDTDREILNRVG